MTTAPREPETSAAWVAEATAWVDARLAGLGRARTGPLVVGRSRPWGRVAHAPTAGGTVWLKAPARTLMFELGLVSALSRLDSPLVPAPLAVDRGHGRLLLADQGRPFCDAYDDAERPGRFAAALVEVGRLQRASARVVPELLAAGVVDVRPSAVPARLHELVADGAVAAPDPADHVRLAVACAELARSAVPAAIDHNDFHDGNVMVDTAGTVTVLDWGDSVVAHPFAVLLVAQRVLASLWGDVAPDHPFLVAARRDYLAVFADLAPAEDLEATARRAVAVAHVARAWVWQRALATFADADTPVPAEWAQAPQEWVDTGLAALRETSPALE